MHDDIHDQLLGALDGKLPAEVLDTWIRPLRVLDVRDNRVELSVPNKFFRQHLEQHYLEPLRVAAVQVAGPRAQLVLTIDRTAPLPPPPPLAPADCARAGPRSPLQRSRRSSSARRTSSPRPPAGGRRVPGHRLQPAVHLRRGGPRQDPSPPGHRPPRCARSHPHFRIQYLSSEKFTNDLISAIRHDKTPEFRQRYRDDRPPSDRRHPVPLRQGAHPGRVLPHLQRPHAQAADRPVERPLAEGDPGARGAPPLPLPVGHDRGHPAARVRDPRRDPQEEGRARPRRAARRRRLLHRQPREVEHPRARGLPGPDPAPSATSPAGRSPSTSPRRSSPTSGAPRSTWSRSTTSSAASPRSSTSSPRTSAPRPGPRPSPSPASSRCTSRAS